MKSPHKGVARIFKAFGYSWDGFKAVFRSEAALRQEIALFVVLSIILVFIPASYIEKILMISSMTLVLLMELVNSAIEAVVDRISPEFHELCKKAKDIGSLIVLVAFVNLAIVWGWILVNNFLLTF